MNDRHLQEALLRIKHGDEFKAFREHLQAQLDAEKRALVRASGEEMFRVIQGKAQAYDALLNQIENSNKVLEMLAARK